MTARIYSISYVTTALLFLGLDMVWLGAMAERLYKPLLGRMLEDRFHPGPAALFYAIYTVGIVAFAVIPALRSGSWHAAAGRGALLGLVAYATYDLTNQATLRDWPTLITMADMAWGTVATGIAATLGFLAVRRLLQI